MHELLEYLINESNYKYTEFRLVVQDGGHCYVHVIGRNGTTLDFALPLIINEIPDDVKEQINREIDEFEKKRVRQPSNPPFIGFGVG
jgi:hypothetical protein